VYFQKRTRSKSSCYSVLVVCSVVFQIANGATRTLICANRLTPTEGYSWIVTYQNWRDNVALHV